MKKYLLLFLLLLSKIAFSQVNTSFNSSELRFRIISVDPPTVEVVRANSFQDVIPALSIPESVVYDGDQRSYTVVRIVEEAFRDSQIESVIIPSTVTSIGAFAFSGSGLRELTLPNSITEIEDQVFQNNRLTAVEIPASVVTIGANAFFENDIRTLTFSANSNLETIEMSAFARNTELQSIEIPAKVTRVVNSAFAETGITLITSLNPNPIRILPSSFSGRISEITLNIPFDRLSAYESQGWVGFSRVNELPLREGDLIYDRISGDSDNNLRVLGRAEGVTNLDIVIPETVIDPNSGTEYTVTFIERTAFFSDQLTSVVMLNSITGIGDFAFSQNNLEEVVLSSNLTDIGDFAFRFNNLTSIEIPDSVELIREGAFQDSGLTELNISPLSNLMSIQAEAFADNAITSLEIPASLELIRVSTFARNSIQTITFAPDSRLRGIGVDAFLSNQLTSITLPSTLRNLGNRAFSGNDNLSSIISLSTDPPLLNRSIPTLNFVDPFLGLDRSQITLSIPPGTRDLYERRDWTDFLITEEEFVLSTEETVASLFDSIIIDAYSTPNSISIKNTKDSDFYQLSIYSISGVKVAASDQTTISTAGLSKGLYILQVISNKGTITRKFVK